MVEYSEIMNLSRDELLEEYCKLFDRYEDLRESSEKDTQKIHELKRSLHTATAAQAYLSQELDQYTNSENNKIENELHKTQIELVEVKRKYNKFETSFANLQQEYNLLVEENSKIKEILEEERKLKEQLPAEMDTKIIDEYLLNIQMLENENLDLVQKIEDFEERSVRYTFTIAECERNIEVLKDQIFCLEENLQSKRLDLEEKMMILESTQEQLADANKKMSKMSTDPDNNNRKGNSLFAEVDEQRQAMKVLLETERKHYIEMKKIYKESEQEIRRLKRENISMHTELEACSTIFCSADKIYKDKLYERIRNLLDQNEELESKLKWTQERLKEVSAEKGVSFLDSMLSFCKKETDELKSQLHRERIQNASLEEQLRNSQQDVARWRFEALKSRCVLIDREQLLTEHKINFKDVHAMDYNISEKDQKEAKPRIVTRRRSSLLENVIRRKSTSPTKVPIKEEIESQQKSLIVDSAISNNPNNNELIQKLDIGSDSTNITSKNEKTSEKESSQSDMKKIVLEEINQTTVNIELNESLNMPNNKEQNNSEDKENDSNAMTLDNFAKLKIKHPSPMRLSQRNIENTSLKTFSPPARSILTKQNDLLFKDSAKNVKFSSCGDTVHNISYETPSSSSPPTSFKTDNNADISEVKSKNTAKQLRTKSNVVVRHFVVSSKHDKFCS